MGQERLSLKVHSHDVALKICAVQITACNSIFAPCMGPTKICSKVTHCVKKVTRRVKNVTRC